MSEAPHFLRRHAFTIGMIVVTLLLYVFIFFLNASEKKETKPVSLEKKNEVVLKYFKMKEENFKNKLLKHPAWIGGGALCLALVFTLALGVNFYLLNKKLRGAPLLLSTLPHESVPWGMAQVAQIFIALFFVEALLLAIEGGVGVFWEGPGLGKNGVLMINSLLRDSLVAGFVLFLVTQRFQKSISEIGLTTKNLFVNIKIGIIGYLAVIPTLLFVLLGVAWVAQLFSYEPPPQPVVEIYLKETRQGNLIFFTFFVAIAGPLIEEIFFRGFTYKALRTRFGIRNAPLVSSALFAALHMNGVAFFPIFILGIFLAYLYEHTGSLVPSMTVHVLHNLVMVSLTLGFKALSQS